MAPGAPALEEAMSCDTGTGTERNYPSRCTDGKWELFLTPTVHDGEGKLAFHKINPLCKLEEQHAVDLGSGYKNDCIWDA